MRISDWSSDVCSSDLLDLDAEPPASLEALRGYVEGTSTSLVRLALHVLGADDAASREAAGQLGTAWAYLGLLRALPLHARQKRCYLPADLMAETGVDLRDLFELRSTPALTAACNRLRSEEH